MSFFRSPKLRKSQGERSGLYWGCWCFSTKSLKLIHHQIGSIGTGIFMKKNNSVRQHYRAFSLYRRSQHPQPPETKHISLLFFACLHFQCWTKTLYTTLTSRAIKKQLCGPVRFHYACLLLYRWQYRYVTTVSPTFARTEAWMKIIGYETAISDIWPWQQRTKWIALCVAIIEIMW